MNTPITKQSKTPSNERNKAWYQYPFVWMLIFIPFSAVVVGGILLTLSITSFDGLVVDDYYKKGKEINRVLKRDKNAKALQLTASIDFSHPTQTVIKLRQSNQDQGQTQKPDNLRLQLLHPTRAGLDQTITMNLAPNGDYIGAAGKYTTGKWLIQLETNDWRLTGVAQFPTSALVQMRSL